MNVGIVGGGTMGLTLAYRLSRRGHQVTALEGAAQIGGLSTWFDYGDFVWDKFYHVILRSDAHLLGLIEELGLSTRLNWAQTKTGFLWQGRLLSMSSHWEFLTFPALSAIDKLRLAAGILRCQRISDPSALESMPAAAWLQRLFGARVYQTLWAPLLESKFGALSPKVPATIMWATIRRYYSTRSKSQGAESMGFLSGGLKALFETLAQAIEAQGGRIVCCAPVASIDESPRGKVLVQAGAQRYEFDCLISTLPTALLRSIAPQLRGDLPDPSADPQFLGVLCMALVLRRPLSPYYVTNLIQRGLPFTGLIEVSNLAGPRALNGRFLAMLPRYELPDSPWFQKSSEEIAAEFLAALKPVWPDVEDNLVRSFVHRERRVQALWINRPPAAAAPLRAWNGKVWSVNAELAGRDTLNNNAIVRVANQAAEWFI